MDQRKTMQYNLEVTTIILKKKKPRVVNYESFNV